MDNSKIGVIKAPGYFKLFKCGKESLNNLDVTYDCAWMENAKNKYWGEIYDNIIKWNDQHHTPWSNVGIREPINQVTR